MSNKTVLKFIPVPGHVVTADPPGSPIIPGQTRQQAGRTFNPKKHKYETDSKPFEVLKGTPLAANVVRAAKKGSILPFDQETADACGLDFVPMKFSKYRGEWVPEHS